MAFNEIQDLEASVDILVVKRHGVQSLNNIGRSLENDQQAQQLWCTLTCSNWSHAHCAFIVGFATLVQQLIPGRFPTHLTLFFTLKLR
jgi:hypothetical protein